MNPKLYIVLGITVLCVCLISFLTNWQGTVHSEANAATGEALVVLDERETWRSSFERVNAYAPPKVPVQKPRPQPKPNKRVPRLTDKRLIAIVENSPKSVLLINARGNNKVTQELTLGQSWLAPWQLAEIHSDFIVWKNSNTNQKQQQFLFRR